MITRLDELAHQSEHLPTAYNAVRDALDRAGVGENQRGANTGSSAPVIHVGIFGGDPAIAVGVQAVTLPETSDAIDAAYAVDDSQPAE